MTRTISPVSAQINAPSVTLNLPESASHLADYTWREDRRPAAVGDYRARAYRLSNGNPADSLYVVTCELILSDSDGFLICDVLDVAYPQDRTDLSDEMRYAADWARDMSRGVSEAEGRAADVAAAQAHARSEAQAIRGRDHETALADPRQAAQNTSDRDASIPVSVMPTRVSDLRRSDVVLTPVTTTEMHPDMLSAALNDEFNPHDWDDRAFISEAAQNASGGTDVTAQMVADHNGGSVWTRTYRSDALVLVAVIQAPSAF